MIQSLVLIVATCFAFSLSAQKRTLPVPHDRLVDSVFLDIYRLDHPDPATDSYGIGYSRSFGWLAPSAKFDTDSFYQWTKQKCIEKVGEIFFYQHFRLGRHSFKDEWSTEVYTITYLIVPFQDSTLVKYNNQYVYLSFKRFDFLGYSETQIPVNLPDCIADPELCAFRYDRQRVMAITREKVIGDQKIIDGPYLQLGADFGWQVSVELAGAGIKQFTVDGRTGVMSEIKTSWRID